MRPCALLFLLLTLVAPDKTALAAGDALIVTDAAGRRVTIAEPVKRVVTTFKPATLFMLSLADSGILAGIDSPSRRDPLVLAIAPEAAGLPGVGSKSKGISIEAVLKIAPDLVVLYAHKDGLHMAERLERVDIPAIVIEPETFDSMRDTIHILAAATGRQDRARAVIAAIDGILAQIAARVADIPNDERKCVYYGTPRGFLSTAPADMLQDQIISLAGGVNSAAHLQGYFKTISTENLIQWAPDVITVSRGIRSGTLEMLRQNVFSRLPAVQTGSIYVFPSSLTPWDFPSPLSALSVLWLSARLYPDRFSDFSVMNSVDRFHETLFGRSMTTMGGRLDDRLEGLEKKSPVLSGTDKKP